MALRTRDDTQGHDRFAVLTRWARSEITKYARRAGLNFLLHFAYLLQQVLLYGVQYIST
jgi:hypothetical protein